MNIRLRLLDPRFDKTVPIPQYQTEGSAGIDLRCMTEDYLELVPRDEIVVPSGIAVFLEHRAVMGQIVPRSSLGMKGLMLMNTVGIIDSDYQGPIMLMLRNVGRETIRIEPCERIAQLILVGIYKVDSFSIVDEFPTITKRALGGFGSTGAL